MSDYELNEILAVAQVPEPPEDWEDYDLRVARVIAAAVRAKTLEDAALAAAAILDMQEEAKADQASREAKGTDEELPRLRHWATVSTFNAGVRRCVAAIRALKEQS